ncbi:amidase [Cyanobacterium sp. uoEpiScrs1]|uniref:amidase n=1 Tax=Cyanobacterium sp. uoEpiScrs1 TaxID=2976343 RepID=UPI00226ABEA3|nr:amidase [Cyanobacterium sp. uoEpiScrs1]
MNSLDLAFAPALELAQLIRDHQISPLELTHVYLNRIKQYDPQIGSFFAIAEDLALAEAKAKTEQLIQTSDTNTLPPFFGVPTAIKDLNAVARMPLSYGISVFKDKVVDYDDEVVRRIKKAGFIILGKTATSQLGSFPYTEPPGFPPTRNPWHLDYVAGGSSGGAAAAVAAGLCPIAQGSDGGGSIRIPAACCGLVGIKPSRGRVSNAPVGDFQSGISTHGPLGRTVADAAALLDVMAGYTTGDPYWLASPKISFLEATRQSSAPLRVAFSTTIDPFPEPEQVIKEVVYKTAKLLADMGHEVEYSCPDFHKLTNPFKQIWQAGILATGVPLKLLSPINQWLGEQAKTTEKYLQAVHQMQIISRQIVAFFDCFDLLVLPVYLKQPIKIGEWSNLSPEETVENIIKWIAPCPPCNASGLPGITLSMGQDKNGLPVGVQLIGKPADELTLIRVAAELEKMTDRLLFKMIEL